MLRAPLSRSGGSPPPPILPPGRVGGMGRRGWGMRGRGARLFGLALAGMAGLSGCVSLDTAAPSTATLLASQSVQGQGPAKTSTAPVSTLALGRDLYVGRCAKCHAVEPVRDYSPAEWATLIPDMAERTKLNAAETAAVAAYVHAVLRMPP
ncbi:MAG: hypothetical protein JWL81_244 [Verrucomicrobiales bacterium]|nr:hypothetical protein [Verrucomicrobiales bacterium]